MPCDEYHHILRFLPNLLVLQVRKKIFEHYLPTAVTQVAGMEMEGVRGLVDLLRRRLRRLLDRYKRMENTLPKCSDLGSLPVVAI